jgi:hypothetical protein
MVNVTLTNAKGAQTQAATIDAKTLSRETKKQESSSSDNEMIPSGNSDEDDKARSLSEDADA